MKPVPFYSQMVNWNGEDSGFPNDDEIRRWESNCCGIACTRMIVEYYTGSSVGYWDLLQKGIKMKAYNSVGWIHKGLVDLASDFGVAGEAHRGKSLVDIYASVRKGNICIVSASAGFRGGLRKHDSEEVFGKGGHLIVAFQNEEGLLTCHHPSSVAEWNKQNWVVSKDLWEKSFSGGFMEFYIKKEDAKANI